MTRIPVACDGCGHQFRVKEELLGKRVKCPSCSTAVRVQAESENDLPPPTPRRKASNKSASKSQSQLSKLLAGAVTVLLVICGIGLKVYFRVNRIQERNAARIDNSTIAPSAIGANRPTTPSSSNSSTSQVVSAAQQASAQVLTKEVTVVTKANPKLTIQIRLPNDWRSLTGDFFERRDQPQSSLIVAGGGKLSAVETAALLRTDLLPAKPNNQEMSLGSYVAQKQPLKSIKARSGPLNETVGVNYLYDLPEGSIILTFLAPRVLRDEDFVLFERIAATMSVSLAPAESGQQ
jgi:hypothetical protein